MKKQHKATGVFGFFFETFEGWDQVGDFTWGFYNPTGFGDIFDVNEEDFEYIEVDIDKGLAALYHKSDGDESDYEYENEDDEFPIGCIVKKIYEIRSETI